MRAFPREVVWVIFASTPLYVASGKVGLLDQGHQGNSSNDDFAHGSRNLNAPLPPVFLDELVSDRSKRSLESARDDCELLESGEMFIKGDSSGGLHPVCEMGDDERGIAKIWIREESPTGYFLFSCEESDQDTVVGYMIYRIKIFAASAPGVSLAGEDDVYSRLSTLSDGLLELLYGESMPTRISMELASAFCIDPDVENKEILSLVEALCRDVVCNWGVFRAFWENF